MAGAGVGGFIKSLDSVSRDQDSFMMKIPDYKVFARAQLVLGHQLGMSVYQDCEFKYGYYDNLRMQISRVKAAGHTNIRPRTLWQDGKDKAVVDPNGSKQSQLLSTCLMIERCLHNIREKLKIHPSSRPIEELPVPIAKCNVKSELKLLSDYVEYSVTSSEYEKARVFFIVPIFQIMIARAIYEPMHNSTNNVGSNFVGFPFAYGGMKDVHDFLNLDDDEPSIFVSGDISGKDQSFPYAALVIFCSMVLLYIPADHPERGLLETLVIWLTRYTAGHVVGWLPPDLWRIVLNALFSGDYNTSFFNTLHMILMWIHYIMVMYPGQEIEVLLDKCLKFLAQGDDYLFRSPKKYLKINAETWKKFIKEHHNQTVKAGSEIQTSFIYSAYDKDFEIDKEKSSLHKFLQRYFIKTTLGTLPFRPFSVYVRKATAWKNLTVCEYMQKLIGLAFDTMGTNIRAYEFLRLLFEWVKKKNNISRSDLVSAWDSSKHMAYRSIKFKWGVDLTAADFATFPSIAKIQDLFLKTNLNGTLFKIRQPRQPQMY
jgi:hypothetical protein